VGALVSGRLIVRLGTRHLIAVGPGMACPRALYSHRAGQRSANIAIMGLISQWFQRSLHGRASGIVVTGSGYAIMLSGLIIPLINQQALRLISIPTGFLVMYLVSPLA
jgi:hypothetical protein